MLPGKLNTRQKTFTFGVIHYTEINYRYTYALRKNDWKTDSGDENRYNGLVFRGCTFDIVLPKGLYSATKPQRIGCDQFLYEC